MIHLIHQKQSDTSMLDLPNFSHLFTIRFITVNLFTFVTIVLIGSGEANTCVIVYYLIH